mmetsp:Transcript_9615/g.22091  ORF Transcript_9615/g.22091 Transcript_9615/m.22091 type:complete len:442 (+) Transcript_9615:73-1398(+)
MNNKAQRRRRRRCSSPHLLSVFALGIIVVCFTPFYTPAVAPSEFDTQGLQTTKLPPRRKNPKNFRRKPTDNRRSSDPRKNDGSKSIVLGGDLDLPDYTRQMAKEAVRPAILACSSFDEWTASEDANKDPEHLPANMPILPGGVASPTREGFAFVHVYKAAGSTLRDLFASFAYVCGASWLALSSCTSADRCIPKFAVADREMFVPDPSTFNKTVAADFDIIGGHFRIGTFDYSDRTLARRHITFLRDAKARFVSGILFHLKRNDDTEMSLEDAVRMIKNRVIGSRKADEYWSKSLTYLLTPEQAASLGTMAKGEDTAKATALMAVQNLVMYNTVVGMTENMADSLSILRHVLSGPGLETGEDTKRRLDDLFDKFSDRERQESVRNRSDMGDRSTTSVLELLEKDTEFMQTFNEYLKYEDLITGYASRMHELQYREVTNSLR